MDVIHRVFWKLDLILEFPQCYCITYAYQMNWINQELQSFMNKIK